MKKTMMTKKKTTKTGLSLLLALMLMGLLLGGCGQDEGMAKIGINQFGEHPSLDNCRTGLLEGLEEAGMVEGQDFEVDYQNAGFDPGIATQIAQSFSAKSVDVMVAIATPSATASYAAAEDKDIPVVFTAITDPEEAKLTDGNVTGTSDKLPIEAQLELIRSLQEEAKTIGILYTTSEPNSLSAIADYEALAGDYGFTIEAIGVSQQSEVTLAADQLIASGVDCMSNLTDNNVVGVLSSILEKTNQAQIPVYGSEVEQVKMGCVAAAGIDYISLGKQTARMLVEVLEKKSARDIPYETIEEYGVYVNEAALASFNLTLGQDMDQESVIFVD